MRRAEAFVGSLARIWIFFSSLFGLLVFDLRTWAWGLLSLVYFLPLTFRWLRWHRLEFVTVWLTVLLFFQTVLAQVSGISVQKHLPNQRYRIQITGAALPGVFGSYDFSTDAKGFRTQSPVAYERKPERSRMFVIGASAVEDVYLDDTKTWSAQLQKHLKREYQIDAEVINTGVSGLRAKHHLSMLRSIEAFQPSHVLILMGANDWNQHIKEHFRHLRDPFIRIREWRENWMVFGTPLANLLVATKQKFSDKGFMRVERMDNGSYYLSQRDSLNRKEKIHWVPKVVSDDFASVLSKIQTTCAKAKYQCLFIEQANAYQATTSKEFMTYFWMTPPNENFTLDFESMKELAGLYNRTIKESAERLNLPYCAVANELTPDASTFYDDLHFNASGAEKLGRQVAKCVSQLARSK